MVDLTKQEDDVFSCFHVTGFFGKKPKPNVGRKTDMIWRSLEANRPDPNRKLEDISAGIQGLVEKGLLRINEKEHVILTDSGYEEILGRSY